jgi:YVTN family beta-propeller protein
VITPSRMLSSLAVLAVAAAILGGAAPLASAHRVFVANWGGESVTPFDSQTALPGSPIAVGVRPRGIAITPDGRTAYVVNAESKSVTPIDVATGVAGTAIAVGAQPQGIAITPDGRFAYVTSGSTKSVWVIDTATNAVVGTPIEVGIGPTGIAITPDGTRAYVTNFSSESISVIDLATNHASASTIAAGNEPAAIAITPDGRFAYVAHNGSGVAVIDLLTNAKVGPTIEVGSFPEGVAITPDGRTAYVANKSSGSVTPIDVATAAAGAEIKVKKEPRGVAITPDGRTAFVTNYGANSVSAIDTTTHQAAAATIKVGTNPEALAIVPDQPPRAAFSAGAAAPGTPVAFDAGASNDSDGAIATYSWNFGDGQTATGGPTVSHTFATAGSYRVTLTLTDDDGCSTSRVFTGQTAYCNGSALATATRDVVVATPPAVLQPLAPLLTSAAPRVRVSCPESAKPGGCSYALQVLSAKPHKSHRKHPKAGRAKAPVAESAVARVKLAPGHRALVTLVPKPKFAAKLAAASSLLVREVETAKGETRTSYRRLKPVP